MRAAFISPGRDHQTRALSFRYGDPTRVIGLSAEQTVKN
jgi:hypothetical protein